MNDGSHVKAAVDALLAKVNRLAHGACSLLATPRLSILIYHRVRAQADELFPYEPDAQRFERVMGFVARSFRVMTLAEAAAGLRQGDLPARALVITFDDGYADNAQVALPILRRCGIGATFFVSTGFLDGGRMWNDSVIEIVRACRRREVDLEVFGLGRCSLAGLAERRALIAALLPRIKYQSLADRDQAIACLHDRCGAPELPDDLMMTSGEVRQLHAAGMEIGAHTVRHPILTTLTPDEAEREIADGRRRLEEIIDAPVDVFAYPNGKPGRDYDQSHVALLARLGFKCAVSTATGVSRTGDDVFQLPRFSPWGESLPVWGARLLVNQKNTRYEVLGAPSDAGP